MNQEHYKETFEAKTVYQAQFHTRHFCFEACALSKDDAIAAIIAGLRLHAQERELDPDWWMDGFEGVPTDEIFEIWEFELGVTYRDHEPLRVQ